MKVYVFKVTYVGKTLGWLVTTPAGNKMFDTETDARQYASGIEAKFKSINEEGEKNA